MMRKLLSLIFISSLFAVFFGCAPVDYIKTETLKPAKVTIPTKIKSAVILLKKPANDFDNVKIDSFRDTILEEVKYGMADALYKSPRFNPDQIVIPDDSLTEKYLNKDSLHWLDKTKLANEFNVDAIFLLDSFTLNKNIKNAHVIRDGMLLYQIKIKITSYAMWEIYYPYQKLTIDEYEYSEEFLWESLDYNKDKAIKRLPEYNKTFREAAYWTGYDYGNRITPTWEKTLRKYYIGGTESFREAREQVKAGKWQQAIKYWKEALDHSDPEIVSRAAYNIAIGFEMMGEIKLALKWARKSLQIKSKSRTKNYIEILEARKKTIPKLRHQID